MDDDCPCRDCAGDPCTCSLGDHCGTGPNCSCCGYVNYRWLGYLGAVARWAKAWGVSKSEAGRRIENNQRVGHTIDRLVLALESARDVIHRANCPAPASLPQKCWKECEEAVDAMLEAGWMPLGEKL